MNRALCSHPLPFLLLLGLLVVTATPSSGQVRELSFQDSGQRLGVGRTFVILPADLDGDGDPDLLVMDFHGQSQIWTNEGNGVFNPAGDPLGGEGGHGAAFGDLDGDGDLDLFLVHNGDTDRIFLNDGHGSFSDSGQSLGADEEWGTNVALEDLDSDGDLDAYVTVYQGSGHLWINDGQGRFTDSNRSFEGNAVSVAFGDLDGDLDADAVTTYSGDFDRVWLNDGRGAFRDSGQRLGREEAFGHVVLGDLDGDGDLDALVTNPEVGNEVWVNDGSGAFSPTGEFFGVGSRGALGDLDGDADLDFIATNQQRTWNYWLNDGAGVFTGEGTPLGDTGALAISLVDVDGDTDLDAFLGTMEGPGGSRLLLNQSTTEVPPFRLDRLSERVLVLTEISPMENILVAMATERGLVVVDATGSPYTAGMLREIIENEFGRNDFAFVVQTHYHWDHAWGNTAFPEAKIIAHRSSLDLVHRDRARLPEILTRREQRLEELEDQLASLPPGSGERESLEERKSFEKRVVRGLGSGFDIRSPDITFTDGMSLDLGDLTLDLTFFGRAHSGGDVMIQIPEEGLLLTGDLFLEMGWLPLFVGQGVLDIPRWIAVLNQLFDREDELRWVIPGHREIWTPQKLDLWRGYIVELWEGVKAAKAEGATLESVLARFPLDARFDYLKELGHTDEELMRFQRENVEGFWRQLVH